MLNITVSTFCFKLFVLSWSGFVLKTSRTKDLQNLWKIMIWLSILSSLEGRKHLSSSNLHNSLKQVLLLFLCTGKSMSQALIFASTNPQYDIRLFIELPVQYMKIQSSEHGENIGRTWVEHVVLNVRNNFFTQHVLPRLELGILMYWLVIQLTIWCHIVG